MKRLFLALILGIFLLSFISAEYEPHKINTALEISYTSNKGTSCNLTTGNTPYGVVHINQQATRSGQTFNNSLEASYFNELGTYCFNLLCVYGTDYATQDFCREVTSTGKNSGTLLPLFLLLGGFILLGFAAWLKNEYLGLLSGLLLIVSGVYMLIYGLGNINDMYTRAIAYVIGIGLGSILSFISMIEMFYSYRGESFIGGGDDED